MRQFTENLADSISDCIRRNYNHVTTGQYQSISRIKCASISIDDVILMHPIEVNLPVGYTKEQDIDFFRLLDFEYDPAGYHITGIIWFEDGSWATWDSPTSEWIILWAPRIPARLQTK